MESRKIKWTQYTLLKKLQLNIETQQTFNYFKEIYKPLLIKHSTFIITMYSSIPFTEVEIVNIVEECFYFTLINYNPKYKKSLPAYIKKYLGYSLQAELRKYTTKKHQVMNFADYNLEEHQKFFNTAEYFRLDAAEFEKMILSNLSSSDKEIFTLLLDSKSIKEISNLKNMSLQNLYLRRKNIGGTALRIYNTNFK